VIGPLHGLPLTIKDAYETAGLRSTGGAKRWSGHVPTRHADAVQRLADAGAVIFGKTNLPEFSADMQSYNPLFGTTNNPHDRTRTPGGSSGGAAVAVACGFTAFELGSDIGGSIRSPANWTGVYGHKPSYAVVPMRGHMPGPPGALSYQDLAVSGPLARSASDLELALSVLAGPSGEMAKAYRLSLPQPRRRKLSEYRIAAWLDDPAFPVDAELVRLFEQSLDALRGAGARIDERARPDLTLSEIHENYLALLTPIMVSDVPQRTLDGIAELGTLPRVDGAEDPFVTFSRRAVQRHVDWLHENERRMRHCARLASFFQRFDVLLCPVNQVAAIPHDHSDSSLTRTITVNGRARPYMDLLSWISLATAAYLPATVAPVGYTANGLPVGVQIVGAQFEDLTTIAFAAQLSQVVGGFQAPAGFGAG
jgi:amidase